MTSSLNSFQPLFDLLPNFGRVKDNGSASYTISELAFMHQSMFQLELLSLPAIFFIPYFTLHHIITPADAFISQLGSVQVTVRIVAADVVDDAPFCGSCVGQYYVSLPTIHLPVTSCCVDDAGDDDSVGSI